MKTAILILGLMFASPALASYSPATIVTDPAGVNQATVTSGGALKVDASATTQPVSGNVTATVSGTPSVSVTNFPASQAVTATALPLPSNAAQETGGNLATIATNTTGVSTAAAQATGNASLASIDAGIPSSTGLSSVTNSMPVALPNATTLTTAAYTSSTGVINTDLLSGTVSGWYDAAGYNSFYADIYTTTTVTGGVITFEQTNDITNDASGVTLNLQDSTAITQTNVTTLTLAASTIKHYQAPITSRYIRFRLSTAFAGTGTVGATVNFKQTPYNPLTTAVTQATSSSLNVTLGSGTVSTVSTVTSSNTAIPAIVGDVASAAITTTTTTATLTPTYGSSYQVNIPVTVVSGTTPTMDVEIQESADTGTNWYPVYDFPRISAIGSYNSPPLPLTGNRVRYVQTILGTTPSFTRAINRLQSSQPATVLRQIVDRTLVPTTAGSTTAALFVSGTKNLMLTINLGTATTAPAIQLQCSDDFGATYYSIGTALTATTSSTVSETVLNVACQYARAIVTSAGVAVSADYVLIRGF